jgi:hypothetical protein
MFYASFEIQASAADGSAALEPQGEMIDATFEAIRDEFMGLETLYGHGNVVVTISRDPT